MRILTFIIIISLLVSCGTKKDEEEANNTVELPKTEFEDKEEKERERRVIKITESELNQFRGAYDASEKWEKEFMPRLIQTIEKFSGRPADTTIFTIGNIDGFAGPDTIKSHIYALDGTIYVESSWHRYGELLWRDTQENPYLGVNNDDIFDYEQRHPWVTFTIAVHYSVPELSNRTDYSDIDRETALKMAKWYIESNNLQISEKDYAQYFDSFEGQLFIFGEPESRHELLQWYEPKKQFIRYYAP